MAYSAATIIADALAIAKCPGFTQQGGRALNLVLDDLVLHRNLKVNLVSSTITMTPNSNGPFPLEALYLRTYDMFYYVNGEPYFIVPCSLKQLDQDNVKINLGSFPYEWASDLSPVASGGVGNLYIYPTSNSALAVTHRYYLRQNPITTPESSASIPWFSDQDYLMQAVATRMMRITDDTRYDRFVAECERMLMAHLLTEGDEQQVVKEVALDPRRFRLKNSTKSTKASPF